MNMNAFKARAVKAFMYTQHAFEFFVERQGMRKIFKINKLFKTMQWGGRGLLKLQF